MGLPEKIIIHPNLNRIPLRRQKAIRLPQPLTKDVRTAIL